MAKQALDELVQRIAQRWDCKPLDLHVTAPLNLCPRLAKLATVFGIVYGLFRDRVAEREFLRRHQDLLGGSVLDGLLSTNEHKFDAAFGLVMYLSNN